MPARRSDKAKQIDALIGARLRELRERRGFSQGGLAERLGLKSRQAVASYEAGDAISAAMLFQLTDILQVGPHDFYEGVAHGRPQLAEEAPRRSPSRTAQITALLQRIPSAHHPMILKLVRALAEGLGPEEPADGDAPPTPDLPG